MLSGCHWRWEKLNTDLLSQHKVKRCRLKSSVFFNLKLKAMEAMNASLHDSHRMYCEILVAQSDFAFDRIFTLTLYVILWWSLHSLLLVWKHLNRHTDQQLIAETWDGYVTWLKACHINCVPGFTQWCGTDYINVTCPPVPHCNFAFIKLNSCRTDGLTL